MLYHQPALTEAPDWKCPHCAAFRERNYMGPAADLCGVSHTWYFLPFTEDSPAEEASKRSSVRAATHASADHAGVLGIGR